jgi:hypothetical protein
VKDGKEERKGRGPEKKNRKERKNSQLWGTVKVKIDWVKGQRRLWVQKSNAWVRKEKDEEKSLGLTH